MDDRSVSEHDRSRSAEISAFDDITVTRRRSSSIRSQRSPVAQQREIETAKRVAWKNQNREEREQARKAKEDRQRRLEIEQQDGRRELLDQLLTSDAREMQRGSDTNLRAQNRPSLPHLVIDTSCVEQGETGDTDVADEEDNNVDDSKTSQNQSYKRHTLEHNFGRLRAMSSVSPGDGVKRSTTIGPGNPSSDPSRRTHKLERSKTGRLLRSLTNRGINVDPEASFSQRKRAVGRTERRRQPPNLVRTELADVCENAEEPRGFCCQDWWTYTVWVFTWWILPFCLRRFGGMHDKPTQWAWREKTTLCMIIALCCIGLAFFTFAFQQVSCGISVAVPRFKRGQIPSTLTDSVEVRGNFHSLPLEKHEFARGLPVGADASAMFQPDLSDCEGTAFSEYPWICSIAAFPGQTFCHQVNGPLPGLIGQIEYDWNDVEDSSNLVVYNGNILDTGIILNDPALRNWDQSITELLEDSLVRSSRDVSFFWKDRRVGKCISNLLMVGYVDVKTFGCLLSDVVLIVSLTVIISLVLLRFFLATYFSWFISRELGRMRFRRRKKGSKTKRRSLKTYDEDEVWGQVVKGSTRKRGALTPAGQDLMDMELASWREGVDRSLRSGFFDAELGNSTRDLNSATRLETGGNEPMVSIQLDLNSRSEESSPSKSQNSAFEDDEDDATSVYSMASDVDPNVRTIDPLYTVILVTCYSEDEDGIRTTLDSVATTDFPDKYKLIFVVADGIITGSGQSKSTPECILGLMHLEGEEPEAKEYVAIGTGDKAKNMAKVYAGYYKAVDGEGLTHKVAMVTVVKCGAPAEANAAKPGNRGKRDSQVLLMDFFSKVSLDDPLSPLQFDLFCKVYQLTHATADKFEVILMVDADTKVMPDSLTRLVLCMARDPEIMGLCGETRIANKSTSWVTAIQVFEYHISHHLAKSFESIFGGVTCLPGCFCCYRIKSPKRGFWALILANPYIIQQYSASTVDTLHRKNLLLLGEDRFLTTLMLQAFPSRKMMFVPKAVCKTDVPDKFKVLLSQRRRWINSTVHNLLELVLVRELCGTFCFSMQFVVAVELFGTVVLPAAITFTFYLIIVTFAGPTIPWIPLLLLFAILGLPAVLILITSAKVVYIWWMIIYLMALPIWNFVLPVYAYWHFDDFSWGETRKVAGEGGGAGGHGDGEGSTADAIASVPVRHFLEWMNDCLPQSKHTKKFNEIVDLESTQMTKISKIDPILKKSRSKVTLKPSGSTTSISSLWSKKSRTNLDFESTFTIGNTLSPTPRHPPSPGAFKSSRSHHNFKNTTDTFLSRRDRERVLAAPSQSEYGELGITRNKEQESDSNHETYGGSSSQQQ